MAKISNKHTTIGFVLFFFGFFLIVSAKAQTIKADNIHYIPDVEVLFSNGVNEFRTGNYEAATRTFERLLNGYPVHQRITAVYIMLGKSYYKTSKFTKAVTVLNELMTKYPTSNYVDDAHYTLAYCHYQLGQYVASLKEFLNVADYGKEKKLVERSRTMAIKVIDNNISTNEIQQLKDTVTGEISSAILTIKHSQRLLDQGDREKAISLLVAFTQQQSKNSYLDHVKDMLKKAHINAAAQEVTVGVILPLSGDYAEQAKSVLAGIYYAQKKFNNSSEMKANLVVKDSEGDMVKVVKSSQELSRDNRVIAIIGDLERDNTIAISAVLDKSNIPLIAPTTSGNGVTSLNDYTFQINSDHETRGRLLAQYAIEKLGLNTFATLAPADNYGKDMTDSFTATVDQLGGKIIAQKWYYSDAKDLKRQFQSIREIGLEAEENVFNFRSTDKEKEDVPVTSIDGIFFPCYTEEIQYIAPQFAFANIKAQIIGGEYWYDADKLRNSQKYIEGIVFCSGYYFDETNTDYIKYRNDFRIMMKRTPEVLESYGYDAMNVILDAIANKQITRGDVNNYLDNLEDFKGLRGPISFKNTNGANSRIRILTYRNGRIEPLE
jgi:branched-chain amino acid transport system substrate-binding protein